MSANVTVLGAGSWRTALACLLAQNGHQTTLWVRNIEKASTIAEKHENTEYLPGVDLPEELMITHEIRNCLPLSDYVVIITPSPTVCEMMERAQPFLHEGQIIINAVKGIEEQSLLRLSEVI